MTGRLLMAGIAAALLATDPGNFAAARNGGEAWGAEISASREGAPGTAGRIPDAGRSTDRRIEREKRFIQRTLDDLRLSLSLAREDIAELEKAIDAITPLESPQRERDFRGLLDWYYDHADWLEGEIGDFEDDLALVADLSPAEGRGWVTRYEELAEKLKGFAKEVGKMAEGYQAEEKRLAGIIERRRLVQGRFDDLEVRLARIEEDLKDLRMSPSERKEHEHKRTKLRNDIRVVQNELLSLPLVDEDLLKHYAVLAERGREESEWLSVKIDQYEALMDVAAATGSGGRGNASALEAVYRRAIRALDGETKRLGRKSDALDRKRERVTPAGTLREMDRSRELADFYERLLSRYDNEIRRLRVAVGAYGAELAEVLSEK